jgi:subtilase family serine protease
MARRTLVSAALTWIAIGLMVLPPAGLASGVSAHPASEKMGPIEPDVEVLRAEANRAIPDVEPGLQVANSGSTDAPTPATIQILLTFHYSNSSELGRLLHELSDPSSSDFGAYLTQEQFDARFGGSSSGYHAAVAFLRSFGVTHVTEYADRSTLEFDANPAQVDAIFHIRIVERLDRLGRSYYAPEGSPELPVDLARMTVGVEGLSDYSKFLVSTGPRTKLELPPGSSPVAARSPSSPAASYNSTPCSTAGGPFNCVKVGGRLYPTPFGGNLLATSLQVAYGTSSLDHHYGFPRNSSVATILWVNTIDNSSGAGTYCASLSSTQYAAPYYPSDVNDYFTYALPAGEPKPHVIGVPIVDGTGQAPAPGRSASCDSGGNEFESTLDVDMVGSLAPGANVWEVYGDGGSSAEGDLALADILNPSRTEGTGLTHAAIAGLKNVTTISNSWGYQVLNDTSWYNSLQQAQIRGITVLDADPDSGANSTNSPAAMAYDSFGTVAVGGTTIHLNATTLSRASEIAWWEGPGSGYGSGGGVADTNASYLNCGAGALQCFPEPSWQRSSSDANGVVTAVASGRGEPDLAAIANDTLLSLTYSGGNYSILCLVQSCPVFIFSGNSIACPVTAGILDSVDFALEKQGRPRLGFLDPVVYSLGQGEYAGNFSGSNGESPFFDVSQYRNANFSALRGYDLVTGWGVVNALNFTNFLMLHNVTFTETGLPSGTPWSVTVAGVQRNSTGSTIIVQLPYGTYPYGPSKITGYPVRPNKGTLHVRTAPVHIAITY